MAVQIQIRRDTAANWVTNDPVLAVGEFGHETDATVLKIGDGVTLYSALPNLLTGTSAFGEYVGVFDASIGTFPVAVNQGDWFNCTVAGTVDGQGFVVGDLLVALVDAPSTVTFAANWTIVPNISVTDHTLLTNIGTNTHAAIDTQLTALALRIKSFTLENPLANDFFTFFFTEVEITADQLNIVVTGGTDVTVQVLFNPTRTVLGATAIRNAGDVVVAGVAGSEFTSFDNAVIPAESWLMVAVTSVTLAPDELHLTLRYT
jgi:hypothetical protein